MNTQVYSKLLRTCYNHLPCSFVFPAADTCPTRLQGKHGHNLFTDDISIRGLTITRIINQLQREGRSSKCTQGGAH